MKQGKNWIAMLFGLLLFCVFLFVYVIADMSMEGNMLMYPHVGYLLPSIVLSLVLLVVTLVMKKKQNMYQLRKISIFFYFFLLVFTVICFPVLPTVCYQTGWYARWARVCYAVNIALTLGWLLPPFACRTDKPKDK